MILTESWVRNKLRYWSILHLSVYIIVSIALVTATQEIHEVAFAIFIAVGFQLFLVLTEVCYLAGLSCRNTCLITFWQVVFIILTGVISIAVIVWLCIVMTWLVHEVISTIT